MKNARPSTRCNRSIDYDAVSKVYDQVREGDPEMVGHMLEGMTLGRTSLVLDIGCGTANNTLLVALATTSQVVVGIDPSAGMLEEAHAKAPDLGLVQATADCLPFTSNLFDFVFMTEVIHHLPDVDTALQEMLRVLGANGSTCIATQSHKQIENRMTSRFFPATAAVDKKRYPDIDVIETAMRRTGFTTVSSTAHLFAPTVLGPDYLKTIESRGYSMLHKISEHDYQEGLKTLRAVYQHGETLVYSAGYTFVRGFKKK